MSVTAAKGFRAAGGASGIKPSGASDTALVATVDGLPVTTVAVFTSNLVAAAPVRICREHLQSAPTAAAVILNSGNANAATGTQGDDVSRETCRAVAEALGVADADVLVCSTGLIGIPMDAAPLVHNIPNLVAALDTTPEAGSAAARSIMTTDTVAKEVVAEFHATTGPADGDDSRAVIVVGGMAKGAAMLAPAMATMLAVITTDAAVDADFAQRALGAAVETSFNSLSVDGCRSTNDTVILMCSGAAHNTPISSDAHPDAPAFANALSEVCRSLASQMADDAEGATKTVTITVHGARTNEEAKPRLDKLRTRTS